MECVKPRVVLLGLIALWACHADITGAPCRDDSNCPDDQVCVDAVCLERTEARADGGGQPPGDAGNDAGVSVLDGGSGVVRDGGVDAGRFGLGATCDAGSKCASGFCADGVCCDLPCDGACEACGATGRCASRDAGLRPLAGHGQCAVTSASTCGTDGTCDGLSRCRTWDAGTLCAGPRCGASGSIGASFCDGVGTCQAPNMQSCGTFACADAGLCATSCSPGGDALCASGRSCVGGACLIPSCTDGVRNGLETGVDCGGAGSCPRCGAGAACAAASDCLSGICASLACTVPFYSWTTSAFTACDAPSCDTGNQTRTVSCARGDGVIVGDAMCSGAKPATSQACTNPTGCSWATSSFGACSNTCGNGTRTRMVTCTRTDLSVAPEIYCTATKPVSSQTCFVNTGCSWFVGGYGACSPTCGPGTMTRTVYCQDSAGVQVSNTFCPTAAPAGAASCSGPACVVYALGHPSAANGPCWSLPTCTGPQPVAPACPANYTQSRYEEACGNPSSCGSSWALCTFNAQAGYGCSTGFYMPVSVRECTHL